MFSGPRLPSEPHIRQPSFGSFRPRIGLKRRPVRPKELSVSLSDRVEVSLSFFLFLSFFFLSSFVFCFSCFCVRKKLPEAFAAVVELRATSSKFVRHDVDETRGCGACCTSAARPIAHTNEQTLTTLQHNTGSGLTLAFSSMCKVLFRV